MEEGTVYAVAVDGMIADDARMVPRIVLWDYCRLDTVE